MSEQVESTAVKLYKNIERQYIEAGDDELLKEELEHRMAVVWKLMSKEEQSKMLTEAKNELMKRFTQSFEKLYPNEGGCCGGSCGCGH